MMPMDAAQAALLQILTTTLSKLVEMDKGGNLR